MSSNYNATLFFILLFFSLSLAYETRLRIVRLQGTDEGNQHSVIADLPVASLLQSPGARADATTWCDEAGHVWLFGGEGYDDNSSKEQPELLSDLWLFNTSRLEWNIMHDGTMQCTLKTVSRENKSSAEELCQNRISVAPKPRKRAASCGVPGIVFVIFGGTDSKGRSLSDTWIYIIHKARWLPLSRRNITKSVHPPTVWSTKSSWCHLDALYVIGSGTNNVTQMWKLSLRTLEWSNESLYLTQQQHCTDIVPLIQPSVANSINIIWNGTFYLYQWQVVHSDTNSLLLSVDLQRWHSLPSTNIMNNWHSKPLLWSDLNWFSKNSGMCSSLTFQQSYDDGGHSCNLHRCYTITAGTSWPRQRLYISSWFYGGNMYIFGGQAAVRNNSETFFNDLYMLQQSDNASSTNYAVITLSLITAVVAFTVFGFGVFCVIRYCDYHRGRKKSRELRIRYAPLRDQTLYE